MFHFIHVYLEEEHGAEVEELNSVQIESEETEHRRHLIEEFDRTKKEEELRKKARTLSEISEGTNFDPAQVRRVMQENKDKFAHWPEPEQPTRYALVEHLQHHQDVQGWQPGLDF